MKQLKFTKAEFAQSALTLESWPILKNAAGLEMKEIAITGRSNVGKSSLLNNLFLKTTLAKVSSTPGKTNTLNFFIVDEEIVLVDLPGYGYAKVSKEVKENWSQYLDLYLKKRKQISLILLLLDVRRTLTKEDIQFINWIITHQKPLLLIFTKCDKVKLEEQKKNVQMNLDLIPYRVQHCLYSIKDPKSRIHLIETLTKLI